MTSSEIWTKKVTQTLTLAAAATVPLFIVLVLRAYHFRPTLGVAFLISGWIALLSAAFLVGRAVLALDRTAQTTWVTQTSGSERERQELLREKKLLLKAIKEVEFDAEMGKIDTDDAMAITSRYRARALEILRLEDSEASYRELVEKELARRLAQPAEAACACGTQNDTDAVFCKTCGAKLGKGRECARE